MSRLRNIVNRYVLNRDITERRREVMQTLISGKEREGHALHRVAVAEGDRDSERQSQEAFREAQRLRESLEKQYAFYARDSAGQRS